MKIAIVTGASSGMGREFVLQLSRYEIWAIARKDSFRALQQQKHPKNNVGLTTK